MSLVDDYYLNHSDFLAKVEDLTAVPPRPTGLPLGRGLLVRLTRLARRALARRPKRF